MKKLNILLLLCMTYPYMGCKKLHPVRSNPSSSITDIRGSISDVNTERSPYVEVYVKITDQANSPILDFQISDFAITENNSPVPLNKITYSRIPLSIVLVLDRSGSMAVESTKDDQGRYAYEQLNEALVGLIDGLSAIDQVAIIDFDHNADTIDQEFTNDKNLLKDTINSGQSRYGGGTALWDASALGVHTVQKGFGNKLLLVMTDGQDGGYTATVNDVINLAKSYNQNVYCIGYGDSSWWNPFADLEKLANDTGGAFYETTSADSLLSIYTSFIPSDIDHSVLHYRTREKGEKQLDVFLNYGVFSEKFSSKYSG